MTKLEKAMYVKQNSIFQKKWESADRMFHIYNVFIEAMNTNYSIRAIYLLLFMTSLV